MNLKGAEWHTSSLIRSPGLCNPRTQPKAPHLPPSPPTMQALRPPPEPGGWGDPSGHLCRASWRCFVFQALAADSSSLCPASPEPGPGRSSPSPLWALRGTCELPARRDLHTGQMSWIVPLMSSCRCSGLTRYRNILRPGFTAKNSSKDSSCRTKRNPAGMTLKTPSRSSGMCKCAKHNAHDKHDTSPQLLTLAGAKLRWDSHPALCSLPFFLPQLLGKLEPSCGITHPAQNKKKKEAKSFKELIATHSR